MVAMPFADCGKAPLGVYPLVDRANLLEPLLDAGIRTAQLRIKDLSGSALSAEIEQAVTFSERYQTRLFINDAWQLAIEAGAYGVHLGQEDLAAMDPTEIDQIRQAGLRLGISTHTPKELEWAAQFQPSYLAIGPVFETRSKQLDYQTAGLHNLRNWTAQSAYPVVAIGGIDVHNLAEVVAAGADGVAMISGLHLPDRSLSDSIKALIQAFDQAYQQRHSV